MITADITLNLSELEAAILVGALREQRWPDDAPMALALRNAIIEQLPAEWHHKVSS
jgi:hypothetical protein